MSLASRDAALREILDGNQEAFLALRRRFPRQSITLSEAQGAIVKGVERLQRLLGVQRAVVPLIWKILQERGARQEPLRFLESASGSGGLLGPLWRHARARGQQLQITATDLDPALVRNLAQRLAKEALPARVEQADVRRLERFPSGSFHAAYLGFTLHHLEPEEALASLRELDRVSSGGLILVDLNRSPLALLAARLLFPLLLREGRRFVVHDGSLSVRRAYTRPELKELLQQAGLAKRYQVSPLPVHHPQRDILNLIRPA